MNRVYTMANKISDEVVKSMLEEYNVKVHGFFETKGLLTVFIFATDQQYVRLTYLNDELLRGVNAITVIAQLVEGFRL